MDSCERPCVRSEGAAVDRNDRPRYVSGQTRSTTTGLCGITGIMIPRLIRETNSNSEIVVIGLLVVLLCRTQCLEVPTLYTTVCTLEQPASLSVKCQYM